MKLLIGGSPCTYWSIAKAHERETIPSGEGWELFLNYVIACNKFQPDYFLYENNKSISVAIQKEITKQLGVEPVLINSALLSAQKRARLYWVGKREQDGSYSQVLIEQPEDKGILLKDILESGAAWQEKGYCLRANYFKASPTNAMNSDHYPQVMKAEPVRIGSVDTNTENKHDASQGYRVYSSDGKSVTICGNAGGRGAKTGLYATPVDGSLQGSKNIYEVKDGTVTINNKQYPIQLEDGYYIIRKLTVTECKRLQTVPDDYIFPVSDTQAYKQLGNGWTVDVIAHIMSHFDGITEEEIEVLSMYDGMSCGHIALDKLGANVTKYVATEIDKWAIQTTQANYPDTIQLGDAFQVRDW